MNFRSNSTPSNEPEINLIPFIDVLLVILIFLMLTTTYSKFNELKLTLPLANAESLTTQPQEIIVLVDANAQYVVDGQILGKVTPETLAAQLQQASQNRDDPLLIISADALAPHQSVISVMEAARSAGLARVTFVTQSSEQKN